MAISSCEAWLKGEFYQYSYTSKDPAAVFFQCTSDYVTTNHAPEHVRFALQRFREAEKGRIWNPNNNYERECQLYREDTVKVLSKAGKNAQISEWEMSSYLSSSPIQRLYSSVVAVFTGARTAR